MVTSEGLPLPGLVGYGFFFRLGRWLRLAPFKDNLSFPGNVRVDDFLTPLKSSAFVNLHLVGIDSADGSGVWHNSGRPGTDRSAAAASGTQGRDSEQIIPCERCGSMLEMLIFVSKATDPGRFEDYAPVHQNGATPVGLQCHSSGQQRP